MKRCLLVLVILLTGCQEWDLQFNAKGGPLTKAIQQLKGRPPREKKKFQRPNS